MSQAKASRDCTDRDRCTLPTASTDAAGTNHIQTGVDLLIKGLLPGQISRMLQVQLAAATDFLWTPLLLLFLANGHRPRLIDARWNAAHWSTMT